MFNRVLISFTIIFSATFLFTENRYKIDFSVLKKVMSDNELNKKKIESIKLMEKNRLVKKMSKNAPSKYRLPEKEKLSKQLSSPAIGEKKAVHFTNDYRLEKLTYMKTHNLHGTHQSNNSIANKMSLRGYENQSNNSDRDCGACLYDYTPYGSECCDSAWDEFGITCAILESEYYWDCSGCDCLGDGDPVCGDGYCSDDENFDNCPEDCSSTVCDDSGGNQTWISDGWCDPINNNSNCDFDGGDCCPCTCVDAANDCTIYGGDCDDCDAQGDAGEICPEECTSCEDQGLVTCWDGSCSNSEEECPEQPDCDAGYISDCADEDCCPETWIGDGLCDGLDQSWGCDLTCYDCDGGDCDAASCTTCEDDGWITCWDNSCAATAEDCPEGGCTDSNACNFDPESESDDGSCTYPDCTGDCEGSVVIDECGVCGGDGSSCAGCNGVLNYISDGWCDGVNNNEGCNYDGGDCCPGDCVDTTYSCEQYGGTCVDCLDPDSADNAEGGQCEDYEIMCSDTDCWNYYLSSTYYDYTCSEIEDFGYDCSICDEAGECPVECSDSGQETCWDGSCVEDLAECPEADCTEAGGVESWISDGYCDNSNNNSNCDWDGGDCCGSTCLVSTYDCVGSGEGSYGACYNECLDPNGNDDCCIDNSCPFTCEGNEQVTCWDNSCADTEADCPEITCADTDCGYYLSWSDYTCQEITNNYGYDCTICYESDECPIECEDEGLVTCWDSSCAATEADCPEFYCQDGYIEDCADDGDCCPEGWIGDGFADCTDQAYGCDLTCYDCDGGDCPDSDCSTCEDDGEFTCWDGSCAVTEGDCPLTCEDQGGIDCWDGSCAVDEDCPEQPDCDAGLIVDCDGSGDCFAENWIGDGLCDGTDQVYGADLCCYDLDGGDCTEAECGDPACGDGICNGDETEESCPDDCAPSVACNECEFDFTAYGSECCDTAWDEFGINCAELEANYNWDCAGCDCPGDETTECGDGNCDDGETEDSCPEDCTPACENALGDVNGDGTINVLDIVQVANHILGSYLLEGCALDAADYNQDGIVNVLDIVQITNVILDGGGRVSVDDASSVKIIQMDGKVRMNANGYVGAIQMSIHHNGDFEIQLTQHALLASFNTIGNDTKLIIVAPESDELFTFEGDAEIVEIIAANSQDYIDVIRVPIEFALHSAYPNPFNPVTTWSYSLPMDSDVLIQVYNLHGRVVETLTNSNMNSGYHAVIWNADAYSSGLYFVKMVAGDYHQTQKLMLVK